MSENSNEMPKWPEDFCWSPDDGYECVANHERARADAWEARCRVLYAAVKAHNDACVQACGEGDQAGVACQYRPYFPRRCPSCPMYERIFDSEGREMLHASIGPLPPKDTP